jgi:acyl carrier protein
MDKIIEILESVRSGVDYTQEDQLVSGKVLDSIDITELVALLEEEYDIQIGMAYMTNENFDSASALLRMVEELLDR